MIDDNICVISHQKMYTMISYTCDTRSSFDKRNDDHAHMHMHIHTHKHTHTHTQMWRQNCRFCEACCSESNRARERQKERETEREKDRKRARERELCRYIERKYFIFHGHPACKLNGVCIHICDSTSEIVYDNNHTHVIYINLRPIV